MKYHLLVDNWSTVNKFISDPLYSYNMSCILDGVWVRDIPEVPNDGDVATGLDPALLTLKIMELAPKISELGVGVFGTGYWTQATLVRSISSLIELSDSNFKINIGLGSGDKKDILEKCGVHLQNRQNIFTDSWDRVIKNSVKLRRNSNSCAFWVATRKIDLIKDMPNVNGLLIPTMSINSLNKIRCSFSEGNIPRIGMLLRVIPDMENINFGKGKATSVLQGSPDFLSGIIKGLEGYVDDIILSIETENPLILYEFLSELIRTLRD
jgi:hypothetical protein